MDEEKKALPAPSKSVMDEVVKLRRHFHRHPEVSFSEQETSVKISERLRELGLEVQPCPTETGAVAVLDTGRPGKTVMQRAHAGRSHMGPQRPLPVRVPARGRDRERREGDDRRRASRVASP